LKLSLVLRTKRFAHSVLHEAKAVAHLLLNDPRAAVARALRML
jgi:hypothetical protein